MVIIKSGKALREIQHKCGARAMDSGALHREGVGEGEKTRRTAVVRFTGEGESGEHDRRRWYASQGKE